MRTYFTNTDIKWKE